MRDGGLVAAGASGGGGDTFNITLAPTFMTGDRSSLTQAAIFIKDQIRELKDRGY